MLFFKADTGNAFTTVRAGFAFTVTILPKISLWPALVAGLVRVFTMQKPGKMNLPVFLTSLAAVAARLSMILPVAFIAAFFMGVGAMMQIAEKREGIEKTSE